MTKEEAIDFAEFLKNNWIINFADMEEFCDMAIEALRKAIPQKPKRIDKNYEFDGNWKKLCPTCMRVLIERVTNDEESYSIYYDYNHHCVCGQAIDWMGEDE